nr:MAG TPA: hypothetical protein [Bacteriophage sp.]
MILGQGNGGPLPCPYYTFIFQLKYRSSRNICVPQTNCSRFADRPLKWTVAAFTSIAVNIVGSTIRP